jgi:hypothetical protein
MKVSLINSGALLLLLSGCANPGKADPSGQSPQPPSSDAAANSGDNSGSGSIAFTAPSGLIDLEGYIVGSSDQVALRSVPNVPGSVGFVGVAPGTYDIILSAKKIQAGGNLATIGTRVSGVVVTGGKTQSLPTPELKMTIALSGKIHLQGDVSPGAINVRIPGTHYRVPTDANGDYNFPALPIGFHDIEISQPGFEQGFISSQDYRESLTLPPISLMRESEAIDSGIYYLGSPQVEAAAVKIILYMQAPKGLTHFRYGVEGGLDTKAWQVLQSSLEIDLPLGKNPKIAVQFSKQGTQLSPVYSVTIPTE